MADPTEVFLIAGPTASGKSALALRLAEAIGGEIVNADALQIYADLRVLTARPAAEDEQRVPHHLFGIADAAEAWSVGRWLTAALPVLEDLRGRGRPAVVVGGTGLYFKALTEGLAEIPPVPAAARAEASALYDRLGEAGFRQALSARDPSAEARIYPGDRQRLTRAFEVHAATGRALSDWQGATAPALEPGRWSAAALEPPRERLYARCDLRLEAMLAKGALEEVRALLTRRLDPRLPAMKAVGVRELARHLSGELGLEEALALAQQETRRYAKRQTTWMRGQMSAWPRITESDAEGQWRQFLALKPALTLG